VHGSNRYRAANENRSHVVRIALEALTTGETRARDRADIVLDQSGRLPALCRGRRGRFDLTATAGRVWARCASRARSSASP